MIDKREVNRLASMQRQRGCLGRVAFAMRLIEQPLAIDLQAQIDLRRARPRQTDTGHLPSVCKRRCSERSAAVFAGGRNISPVQLAIRCGELTTDLPLASSPSKISSLSSVNSVWKKMSCDRRDAARVKNIYLARKGIAQAIENAHRLERLDRRAATASRDGR